MPKHATQTVVAATPAIGLFSKLLPGGSETDLKNLFFVCCATNEYPTGNAISGPETESLWNYYLEFACCVPPDCKDKVQLNAY
jgi:hypothetical protein